MMTKEQRFNKFLTENPDWFRRTYEKVGATPSQIEIILEDYPTEPNWKIAERLGITNIKLSQIVQRLRKYLVGGVQLYKDKRV